MSDRGVESAPRRVLLALLRHGEAEGNRELRYLGSGASGEVALTARGEAQARQAAAALARYPLVAIYASPLRRACATAEALGAATGLEPQPAPDLREQDYGAWEGLTRAEAQARDATLHAAWEAGDDVAPPGGESQGAVHARMIASADELAARHLAPPTPAMPGGVKSAQAPIAGATRSGVILAESQPIASASQTPMIALVSHVGPIKALLAATLGLGPTEARRLLSRMWLDPASICVVEWRLLAPATSGSAAPTDAPRGLLRVFNATDHLNPPPRWRE